MRSAEIGATHVWCRGDDDAFSLHPRHFAPLKTVLVRGSDIWYHGEDCYESPVMIRLSDVVAICLVTPQAMAEAKTDAKIDDITESL